MRSMLSLKLLQEIVIKKITTISGLSLYFSEKIQKNIVHELRKRCAAGVSIVSNNKKEKIIYIQGENTEKILEYLIQINIPKKNIKLCGIY